MKTLMVPLTTMLMVIMPYTVWAEETHGYSRGNAFIYFAAIAAILIYGINDVFRHKWLTRAATLVIAITLYLMLPAK